MTQITIAAQVVNGHLQHEKSLAELEGQHVLATLTVVPKDAANDNGQTEPAPQKSEENAYIDPEAPRWLEVEHDLYFPMRRPANRLRKVRIRKRRGKPCIILPDE